MNEYNTYEIFFRTRNCCVIKVPAHIKNKEKIRDFIVDKIADEELECWVEKWFDFEIEELTAFDFDAAGDYHMV